VALATAVQMNDISLMPMTSDSMSVGTPGTGGGGGPDGRNGSGV
jgi:hypothetical protein